MPPAVLSATALVGDLGEWLTGRMLPFDSKALGKLSRPARYSAARIERELGFRTVRNFAASAAELVVRPAAR
jgi:hypothetical protein